MSGFVPEVYRRERPDLSPFHDISVNDSVLPVVGLGVDLEMHYGEVFITEAHALTVGLCMGMIPVEEKAALENEIADLKTQLSLFRSRNAGLTSGISDLVNAFNSSSVGVLDVPVPNEDSPIGEADGNGSGEHDLSKGLSSESGGGAEVPAKPVQRGKAGNAKPANGKGSAGVSGDSGRDDKYGDIL